MREICGTSIVFAKSKIYNIFEYLQQFIINDSLSEGLMCIR